MRIVPMMLVLLVLLPMMVGGCGGINSGLSIPPGEEFRLGENRHGAFSIAVRNDGAVPVDLLIEGPDGNRTTIATLAPGSSADERFAADTIAIFANPAERTAELTVRITGDTGLSMGYEPAG
jgi:hypothetical protein